MSTPKQTVGQSALEQGSGINLELEVDVWKKIVDVQQHFNDIEMRIRNYALTLLLAVLGAASISLRERTTVQVFGVEVALALLLLAGGIVVWLLFYFMDEWWYHRLLLGAVSVGKTIEDRLKDMIPGIALTEAIGRASPFRFLGREFHSTAKIRIFYWTIAIGLGVLAILAQLAFRAGDDTTESHSFLGAMEWEWWSWVAQVVETVIVVLLAPVAVWQLFLQRSATLHQTVATIISWVQAKEVRESRGLLFDLEDTKNISGLPADKWDPQWKQAADQVSQSFNSAALVARQDPRLQDIWIRPTRRAIINSWKIVQPRVQERRQQQTDLWQEFEWLARKAESS